MRKLLNLASLRNDSGRRYWRGRSGVRIPGRSNRTQRRQRLATAATFLRSCVPFALSRGDGPATRCTIRRNTASIMKICFWIILPTYVLLFSISSRLSKILRTKLSAMLFQFVEDVWLCFGRLGKPVQRFSGRYTRNL